MDPWQIAGVVIAGLTGLILAQYFWPRPVLVREHERGLRWRKGRRVGEVVPGRYWLRPRVDEIHTIDTRRRQTIVAGQEVLTADRVPLKITLVVDFAVTDVARALTEVEHYEGALYTHAQLALRAALADVELDDALGERGELGDRIRGLLREPLAALGVELKGVEVRDFMMAGGLRSAYSDVIQARQEGLAALERARGEGAAVRSLANTAQLVERHPGVMQLRLLQAVEHGSGNRIVIALDPERGAAPRVETVAETDD